MSALIQRFAAVLSGQQSEIASLKHQLAAALADDAADDDAVEAAEAAAAAAQVRANELQQKAFWSLVDADAIEDQQLASLLASYEPAEEEEEVAADSAPEASVEPSEEAVAEPAAEAAAEPDAEPVS